MLTWYRSIIHLKKTVPALAKGDNVMLDETNMKVLSWVRRLQGAPDVVVSVNFTSEPQSVELTIPGAATDSKLKTLLKTPGAADPPSLSQIQLPPFGVYIGELE